MERTSEQRKKRPILKPSRSSHARMQFAGFGCGAPPPRRKNIPKAERSKVLHEAEQLVRDMAAKDDVQVRDSTKNVVPQPNNTSDKYKFMLEKPWRTGHAFHEDDEPSNSHVQEKIEEFKIKDPKSFTTEPAVQSVRDSQPIKVTRKASRDVEGIHDDLVPSNTSLGFDEDFIDDTEDLQQTNDDIASLKEAMSKLKNDHELELQRVVDEQTKLVRSAHEALEQAQLSSRVKMSTLERKLADVTKKAIQQEEADLEMKAKSDLIENQLAKVELDRRMEVTSLRKKLDVAEDRVREMDARVQNMISNDEAEQRLRSTLEKHEEQYRRREAHLEQDLQRLRDENQRIDGEFYALSKDYDLLINQQKDDDDASDFLEDQNAEMAAKIAKLEEASVYAEARHTEALDRAVEEKKGLEDEINTLRLERQQLQEAIDELSASVSIGKENQGSPDISINSTTVQPANIGELWERLKAVELNLEMEQTKTIRLEQENSVLSDKLNTVNDNSPAVLESEASLGMKGTIENLQRQIVAASDELDQAKSKHTELMLQNQQIQKQLNEQEQSYQTEKVKKDIEKSDLESNVKVLEKLLNEARQNIELAEEKGRQLDYVRRMLDSKEKQMDDMKDEQEDLKRDVEKFSEQATLMKRELEESSDRHRNEIEELEAEIRRSNIHIEDLQREVSTLIPVSQEVGRVKMSLHETTEELQRSKSENESLHKQMIALHDEISSLNSTVRELERDLDIANRRNEDIASNLLNLETAQAKEQEFLSEELRESETTIACLMDEIDQMKYMARDLERTKAELEMSKENSLKLEQSLEEIHSSKDRELRVLQSKLVESTQQVSELRDQLLPMTKELQQTTREVEDLKHRLENGDDGGKSQAIRQLEEETSSLRRELEVSAAALELSENQLDSFRRDKDNEFQGINQQISSSRETIVQLQSELNLLKPKVQLFDRKEQECASLTADLAAKEKQIDMCRLQLQDMEEDRNYSRARIAELNDLVHKSGSSHSLLENKANEVARLKAERDTLKQKLGVLEAFATTLEEDNNQKKQLVHEMMSKSDDNGGFSTTGMIESLQKDLERTLKRCADLSLQLADSQFHIDQLTEEIRRSKKSMDTSAHRGFRRSGSYDAPSRTVSRKSITSMLATSISAMDESLRGVTGVRSDESQHGKRNLP